MSTAEKPPAFDAAAPRTDAGEYDGRLRLVAVLFLLPIALLVVRMWTLQVADGREYVRLSTDNHVREIDIAPDRGRILDARGRVVAENAPSWDVYGTPHLLQDFPETLEELTRILHLSEAERARIQTRISQQGRSDFLLRRDITRDQLAAFYTYRDRLAGAYIRVNRRRHYPYDSLGAHIVGFMNEITADEIERLTPFGYRASDHIGRTGLERAFESTLRGAPGRERLVVDVRGRPRDEDVSARLLGAYRRIDPVPGRNLHLTVDVQLQELVERAASERVSGGIVVLDPRDGSILAMFSKPGFNPNAWSGRLSEQEQRLSDNNPFHPMLDKTVQSYFPGSTYKIITALAGLEEGLITTADTIHCPGYFDYGDRRFHCWNRRGHGDLDLVGAMAQSCDIYFYQLGLQLGIDGLAQYATEFGFGERPGLGFNGDSPGVVPTREWHEQHSPGGFQYGFAVNTSVGQGDTRVSPLQLAIAYAAMGNGGTVYYPRIVDRITNVHGDVLFEYPRRVRRTLRFADEHMRAVVEGLAATVHGERGTAAAYQLPWIQVAGKTGTAQVRSLESVRLEDGEVVFRDRDHAWFVAFAPIHDPRVVVSVFLEHGGQGSSAAAPVAMEIIDGYFREILGWDETIEAALATGDRTELDALLGLPATADARPEPARPTQLLPGFLVRQLPDEVLDGP